MKRPLGAAVAAALAAVCLASPARADDDVVALRAQLEQVKVLVADLEARLAAVEAERGRTATTAAPATATQATTSMAAEAAAAVPTAAASAAPTSPSAHRPAPTGAAAQAEASDPSAPPRAQWRRVHAGSSKDEVDKLLGTPTRVFELAGKLVWYYYYPEHGAGSVFFDGSGHVSSLQAPAAW